jgi:O-succinylhomoserine sulfhydrylase
MKEVRAMARTIGPALSPFNGWIFSKSLETLAVRMEKHCENAQKLAEYLSKNKEVQQVKYPFLKSHNQYKLAKKQMRFGGSLVTFELKGGIERCVRFIDNIHLLSITSNLGDTRTTVTHPATTTHSKLTGEERAAVNITEGLIRVSVGLEHIDDIIEDIDQAITHSK